MILTYDMLNMYDNCPMMYRRMYVDKSLPTTTWNTVQDRCCREAMRADLAARINDGRGLSLDALMEVYDRVRDAMLLEIDRPVHPGTLKNFRNHSTRMFQTYLLEFAPTIMPREVGVTVRRELDSDLTLECSIDAMMEREVGVMSIGFWLPSSRVLFNDIHLGMASIITGIGNTVLIQLIINRRYSPRKYNIYFSPEKLQWFERYIRTIVDSINRGAFHACAPFRAKCNEKVCQFYWSCRGAVCQ